MSAGRRISLLWAGSMACFYALFRPVSYSQNTACPRPYPGHLPAFACVLLVAMFSVQVASAGTTIYWINSDFCSNTCYGTASLCNNKCSAGDCPVPPGQIHESTSLTELSNLVGSWASAEGVKVHADIRRWWDNNPLCRWIQTPAFGAPECTAVSGNLSCTVSSSPWIEVCDTWQDGPRSSRKSAFMGCYLGQYIASDQCSVRLRGPGGTNGALADVEPGKAVSGLRAEVTCNGAPSDKAVLLTVLADANTGGHDHHDSTRPPGALSPASGNSPVAFSFTAPAPAGDHVITAKCADNSCGEDTGRMWVGRKGLETLHNSQYYILVGDTPNHFDNHYLSPEAINQVYALTALYQVAKFPSDPLLHLNDASLERGGLFDVASNWVPSHFEHCRGTEIDVRANDKLGAIPSWNYELFKELAAKVGARAMFEIPEDRDGNALYGRRHFHVRITGVKPQCP